MPTKSQCLAANLRQAREKRGFSAARMADWLGIASAQAYQNYEAGRVPRDESILANMAERLGCTVDVLLTRSVDESLVYLDGPSLPLTGMVAEKPRTIEDRLAAIEAGQMEIIRILSEGRKPGTYPLPSVGKKKEGG